MLFRQTHWAAFAALVSTALMAGCSSGAAVELPVPDHVILITLDTTRADHLSSYGYHLQTSPFLDEIAERSVVFDRAYAQSATTKPSHASLFTSLYPLQHGVQNNTLVLDTEFVTMAETLRDAGYSTAAFVSVDAPLGGNIGQGFEVWDEPGDDPINRFRNKLYRPAGATVDRALEWLQANARPEEKLFLWVHVYDPHLPLNPPPEHLEHIQHLVARGGEAAHVSELAGSGISAPAGQNRYFKILQYDAEIHSLDAELRRLAVGLDGLGLHGNGLWIVAADHGQGLGAHNWFGHSVQLYNAQLHVPLMFWFTNGEVPARRVQTQVVELIDVLPTLTDIIGLPSVQQAPAIEGRTLVPFLNGTGRPDRTRFAFGERSRYTDPSRHRQDRGNYEGGSRYAFQDLHYKYVMFTEGDDELYDLQADVDETVDLIADPAYADVAEQMRELLAHKLEQVTEDFRAASTVSPEEIERLRALGYIQ